jgi:hypothetical protein
MKAIRILPRTAALALGLVVCTASPSIASEPWIGPALFVGTARPDGSLQDFQWSTAFTPAWGGAARASRGLWTAGLEVWTNRTTQRIDATQNSLVRATRIELVAGRRVAEFGANRLEARVAGGRMMLGYDPDRVTIDAGAGPVEVALAPVHTWSAGLGLGLDSQVEDQWNVGLAVDWRTYSLDTASRQGATIVYDRQRFDDWSARIEITRRYALTGIALPW